MNRKDIFVFLLLVVIGVGTRVALQDVPNFAPVAALALFAGYFFVHRALAVCVPLTVMLVSDRLVDAGSYDWRLMLTVYGLLTLPVVFSGPLRRFLSLRQESSAKLGFSLLGLIGCSLCCSVLFFLGSNVMVWLTSSWYEPTLAGLAQCLSNAVPFFRYTLAGDALFGCLLFGSYATILSLSRSPERATAQA